DRQDAHTQPGSTPRPAKSRQPHPPMTAECGSPAHELLDFARSGESRPTAMPAAADRTSGRGYSSAVLWLEGHLPGRPGGRVCALLRVGSPQVIVRWNWTIHLA